MDLNDFVDRGQLGRVETYDGHQVHIQALAQERYSHRVVLLLLQGRPTDVRAVWARFHENDLGWRRLVRIPGQCYLKPNPVATLPQGDLEICVVHRGLLPSQAKTWEGPYFTFGPPHFYRLFQALLSIPALPHWEDKLWELAQECRLVHPLVGLNTRVWTMASTAQTWLQHMAQPEWRCYWTYEPEEVGHE